VSTSALAVSPALPQSPAAAARPSPWILDRGRDLLLFVATPLLIVPLVAIATRIWTPQALYAVAIFGALGHHLPGMMRAYGDRELFQRFRTRFIVSPLVLVGVCTASAFIDPSLAAIVLVTYVWGVWHGLMQTHGFLRIYDGKVGSTDRRTVRLDQAMCIAWFGAGTLFSDRAVHHIFQEFYMAGGPQVGTAGVHALRVAAIAGLALVTIAFVANAVVCTRAGRRPSPVKLLLIATGVSYWWYSNLIVGNLLLSALLFELFHDTQYLSIVWVFNRRRVMSGSRVDTPTRFIFRDRAPLVLLYVGLVAAYGSLRFIHPQQDALNRVLTATLAASALLHFYFDSFIWKMKERSTRASLGLAGGAADAARRGFGALVPVGLRWAALVLPIAWLGTAFGRGEALQVRKMEALGQEFPHYALAQHNLAVALASEGQTDAAIAATRRALTLEHDDRGLIADARHNLGALLVDAAKKHLQAGGPDGARAALAALREALTLRPNLATELRDEGVQFAGTGQRGDAALSLQAALVLDPGDRMARGLLERVAGGR
jgi:tetratricopeptide (TPR) repeat protein